MVVTAPFSESERLSAPSRYRDEVRLSASRFRNLKIQALEFISHTYRRFRKVVKNLTKRWRTIMCSHKNSGSPSWQIQTRSSIMQKVLHNRYGGPVITQ